jgi:hypothetical protein
MTGDQSLDAADGEDYSLISLEGDAEINKQLSSRDIVLEEKSPLLGKVFDAKSDKQILVINGQTFFKPTFNSQPTKSMRSQPRHPRITSAYRRERYENRKQVFACCLASFSAFADVLCYHSFGW